MTRARHRVRGHLPHRRIVLQINQTVNTAGDDLFGIREPVFVDAFVLNPGTDVERRRRAAEEELFSDRSFAMSQNRHGFEERQTLYAGEIVRNAIRASGLVESSAIHIDGSLLPRGRQGLPNPARRATACRLLLPPVNSLAIFSRDLRSCNAPGRRKSPLQYPPPGQFPTIHDLVISQTGSRPTIAGGDPVSYGG